MNQNWLVRSNVHWNESLGYRHQLERFENAISVFFPFYDSWGRCLPLRTRSSCQNRIIESKKVVSQSPRSFLPRYSARSADKKELFYSEYFILHSKDQKLTFRVRGWKRHESADNQHCSTGEKPNNEKETLNLVNMQ